MVTQTPFAQRLAALLDERGINQLELAARVGVTRAAMSRYVSGDREPRFVTLIRIAEELDTHVDDLVGPEGARFESTLRLIARSSWTDAQRAAFRQAIDNPEKS